MTWRICPYPTYPYFTVQHTPECERAAAQEKVPAWTAADEANLARRVRRIARKAER